MEPCLKPCLECPELFKEVVGHPLGLSAQAGDINRLLPSIAIGAHRDVVDEVILANIILAIDMEGDINCKIKGNIEGKIEGNMEGKNRRPRWPQTSRGCCRRTRAPSFVA